MNHLRIAAMLFFVCVFSVQLVAVFPDDPPVPEGLSYNAVKRELPRKVRREFKRSLKYMEDREYSLALNQLVQLSGATDNPYIWWARAHCEFRLRKYSDATGSYRTAIALNDGIPALNMDYGTFLILFLKNWDRGSELLVDVFRNNGNPRVLLVFAEAAMYPQFEERILEVFELLAAEFPESPDVLIYYASIMNRLDDDLKAAVYSKKAAELTRDRIYLRQAVQILASNGYFPDARRVLSKLKKVKKRSAEYWEASGYLHLKEHSFEKAVHDYEKALNKNYTTKTLLRLAEIYHYHLNDDGKARHYCKAFLRITDQYPHVFYILAEIERREGDYEEALEYSEKRLELDGSNPACHYYHGKLLIKLKKYERAVQELEIAMNLDPDKQRYRLLLAKTLGHLGRMEEAKKVYENFLNEPLNSLWEEENNRTEN